MKKIIQAIATENAAKESTFGRLSRQPLRDLREQWIRENLGSPNKNPYVINAQHCVMIFGKLPKEDRYKLLSRIFDRTITTTYDLKFGEVMALIKVADELPKDFENFIQEEYARL